MTGIGVFDGELLKDWCVEAVVVDDLFVFEARPRSSPWCEMRCGLKKWLTASMTIEPIIYKANFPTRYIDVSRAKRVADAAAGVV